MKYFGNYLIKSMCSMLIGLLLIVKADAMPSILVTVIGALFLLPGLLGIGMWLYGRFNPRAIIRPGFPLASIGSTLFGIYLIVFPDTFVLYLVILLGIMLTLAGFGQFSSMWVNRKVTPFSWLLLLVPLVLIGVGLYCIFHTFDAAAMPFQLLGAMCVYYGVSDMFMALRQRHYSRIYAKEAAAREKAERMAREAESVDFEVVNAKE